MSIMSKAPNDKYREEYDRIFAKMEKKERILLTEEIDPCGCWNCAEPECGGCADGICGSYIDEEDIKQ